MNRLYSAMELAVSYAALNAAGVVQVEQGFKLLHRHEMGGIIGRQRLPSLSLYRERVPEIVEGMDMRGVILESAKRMHEVVGFSRVVYIDGHFMPYYGGSKILYGYCAQRRLAMHGREYFFVQDENGEPVYATISDGYREMRHYLRDVDQKLRHIYGVRGKELLEVFDRGGYSKEFCVGIARKLRFICWRSDAKSVPEVAEWEEVEVEHQGNRWGEVKQESLYAWERKATFKVGRRAEGFREIWIRKGNKVSAALTNDVRIALGDAVRKLTRRWGAQENMIKELKEHGIDRIHSYRKDEYTEEFLYERGLEEMGEGVERVVDNPKVKVFERPIAEQKGKQRRLAKRIVDAQAKGQSGKKFSQMKAEYARLERRIQRLITKRDTLPKKVLLFDRIQTEKIKRLWDEKKLFFDWLKMNAIWAKKRIRQIVEPFYKDLRDVNKFVHSILTSRTYVRRIGDTLQVEFPPQHSKRKTEALRALCLELNKTDKITLGLRFRRLVFGVREKH